MRAAFLRRRTVIAVSVTLGAVGGGLLFWYVHFRPTDAGAHIERPDPRLTYSGAFRNVHPSVAYVPDSKCGSCHPAIAASFAQHPMGRSLLPIGEADAPLTGRPQHNPFEALGEHYRVETAGTLTRHVRSRLAATGDPVAELAWDVHYVIGSGTRGYSYVSDREGYLFQTPISWYAQKHAWDLSPGFGPIEVLGRNLNQECLYCHANRANSVAGTVNRYRRPVFDGHAIGCQRCHGPGALHVDEPGVAAVNGVDPTIVNPKHLSAALRQSVCEQCHLQGAIRIIAPGRDIDDFRPGLPLEAFWSVYLRASEDGGSRQAVGQVEQMYESRCYQAGAQRLGCVSCHDPHKRVQSGQRVTYYRSRCLQCHQQHGCGVPQAERARQSAEDSCIECHMPVYGASDIPHTAVTDHRIPRDSKTPASPPKVGPVDPGTPGPLISFYRGRSGVDAADDDRCRAVALTRLMLTGDGAARRAVRQAMPALDSALRRDPDDLPAREALGYVLVAQDRTAEALEAFQAVLATAPEQEIALTGAALTAETMGHTGVALGYWRRAVAVNPWAPTYRQRLAQLLLKQEDWDAALPECEAWKRLDPMSAPARMARVSCLLATGNKQEARAEFARVVALAPANLRELHIRFDKKLK